MMKIFFKCILLLTTTLTIASLSAQKMTPEQVVQKQLETYNNRDIDGFMSLIDSKITIHDFSSGLITMKGYAACKKFYGDLFMASPKLHSKILNRTVFGSRVIDHESITGRNGNDEVLELVLIYEVRNKKIIKISVIKGDD